MNEPRQQTPAYNRRPALRALTEPGGASATAPPLLGGCYRLSNRVGSGRLGEIYAAIDEASRSRGVERRVAVQILDADIANERRFVEEIKRGCAAVRETAHPNVVHLLDFGRDGRDFFLVMELLEGASLRLVLQHSAGEALAVDEAMAVTRAIGDAVSHLHTKGMLHGDLRPKNVFVTLDAEVKLLDVAPLHRGHGLPYFVEDAEPRAPKRRDPRDDVYGLACLAYEMLSGRHPFNCNSPLEAHLAGLKPAPVANISRERWQALADALALERARRTPSVAEFLRAFGITGAERLPPPADEPPTTATVPNDAPARWTMLPAPQIAHAEPAAVSIERDAAHSRARLSTAPPRPRRARVLALTAVAALGALVYLRHDQLRDQASDWIETAAGWIAAELGRGRNALVAAVEAPRTAAQAPPLVAASQAAASADGDDLLETTAEPVAAAPPTTPAPAVAAPSAAEPPATTSAAHIDIDFVQPVTTVSEGQGVARILVRRTGALTEPLAFNWWIVGGSATPEEDYANLGRQSERFPAGEEYVTLLVPLVDDRLSEPTENFYVYLTAPGRDEPARARIDIEDDD